MINNNQNNRVKRILYLEDSKEDAEIIAGSINKGGLNFDIIHVSTLQDFTDELENNKPDIILSDFKLPGFDGFDALKMAMDTSPDVPFLFVTGAVGEEMAVKTLKSGATDFILKDRLDRLVPAINRALDEHRTALERKKLYYTLKKSEERYRTLMENLPVGVFRTTVEQPGRILQANPAMVAMHGFDSVDQVLNMNVEELYYEPKNRKDFISVIIKNKSIKNRLMQFKKTTGEPFWASVSAICNYDKNGSPDWIDGVVEDVTERLKAEEKLGLYLKFLEKLMDTINSPVFYKDSDGRYLGCNKKFAELIMGMPREYIPHSMIKCNSIRL